MKLALVLPSWNLESKVYPSVSAIFQNFLILEDSRVLWSLLGNCPFLTANPGGLSSVFKAPPPPAHPHTTPGLFGLIEKPPTSLYSSYPILGCYMWLAGQVLQSPPLLSIVRVLQKETLLQPQPACRAPRSLASLQLKSKPQATFRTHAV